MATTTRKKKTAAELKADLEAAKKRVAFPQFYRHFSWRSFLLALKLKRAELIEVLVAPNPIVETLNVIEDF